MAPTGRDVHLADGRALRVLEDGDPHGRPVFTLHGTPGSHLLYDGSVKLALRHGIRLIGHDRPGYGESTVHSGRSVVDEAADVEAIADDLGLDRFAVYGASGGGPHALACGAALSNRVVAVTAISSVAPWGAEGLDWYGGMAEENILEFGAALKGKTELEEFLEPKRVEQMAVAPDELLAALGSLVTPADTAGMTPEFVTFLWRTTQEALKNGIMGWRDDDLAFARAWGFDHSVIKVPTQIWYGEMDRFVPKGHGEWLAARLPGAEVHTEPDDGHLSLVRRAPEVLEWLASQF